MKRSILLSFLLAGIMLFSISCRQSEPDEKNGTDENRSTVFSGQVISLSDGWTVTNFPEMTYRDGILTVDVWRETDEDKDNDGYYDLEQSQALLSRDGTLLSVAGYETYRENETETVKNSFPALHDGKIIRTFMLEDGCVLTYETRYTDYEANVFINLFDRKGDVLFSVSLADAFGYDLSHDNIASGDIFMVLSALSVTVGEEPIYVILTTEGLVSYRSDGNQIWKQDDGNTPIGILSVDDQLLYLSENRAQEQLLRIVDADNGFIVNSVALPPELTDSAISGTKIICGAGYDLYAYNGRGLYGLNFSQNPEGEMTTVVTQVADWALSDIAPSDIRALCVLDAQTFALVTRDSLDIMNTDNVLAVYSMLADDCIPVKEELVLAVLTDDYYVQFAVRDFNRTSDKYRVVIRDYTKYDRDQLKTAFDTDIASGKVPDMVIMGTYSSMLDPLVPTYERSGLFCDLTPVLSADADFRYDDLLAYVTEPYQYGGKQYIFPLSPIQNMVFGHAEDFPDGTVTAEAFLSIADTWDTPIFPRGSAVSYLREAAVSDCVDEENAVCTFDDGYFASIIKRANTVNIDNSTIDTTIKGTELFRMGQVRMYQTYSGYSSLLQYVQGMVELGGDAVPVGYANRDGVLCMGSVLTDFFAVTEPCAHKAACADFLQCIIDIKRSRCTYRFLSGGYTFYNTDIEDQLAACEGKTFIFDGFGMRVVDDAEAAGENGMHIKLTEADADAYRTYLNSIVRRIDNNTTWAEIFYDEYYENTERSFDQTLEIVQSRVSICLSEQE